MNIKCPITDLIFLDPVLASDGHFYEKKAILCWIIENKSSPITRAKLSDHFYQCIELKQYIDNYLKDYPNKITNQYIATNKCNDNLAELSTILRFGNYANLLNYTEFDFEKLSSMPNYIRLFSECTNKQLINHIVKNTIDLNYIDKDGWTILHHTSSYNNVVFTKALIDNNTNLLIPSKNGSLPIHSACTTNNIDLIKLFLEKDKSLINARGFSKHTVLHTVLTPDRRRAINTNKIIEIVKYLIKNGADINAEDSNGDKPFHLASSLCGAEIIEYLLSLNININSKGQFGNTMLHIACSRHNYTIIKLLIKKDNSLINNLNNKGQSPLHIVFMNNDSGFFVNNSYTIAKYLVKHNAIINLKDNYDNTPFHYACRKNHVHAIKYFLTLDININDKGFYNSTALHFACNHNQIEVAKILIKNNADINAVNDNGDLPLHLAFFKSNIELINLVIGGNLEARTKFGETSFDCACQRGTLEAVKFMIGKGAIMLNKENKFKNSIFWAAEYNTFDVILYLINTNIYWDSIKNDRVVVTLFDPSELIEQNDSIKYSFVELLRMNKKLSSFEIFNLEKICESHKEN